MEPVKFVMIIILSVPMGKNVFHLHALGDNMSHKKDNVWSVMNTQFLNFQTGENAFGHHVVLGNTYLGEASVYNVKIIQFCLLINSNAQLHLVE